MIQKLIPHHRLLLPEIEKNKKMLFRIKHWLEYVVSTLVIKELLRFLPIWF